MWKGTERSQAADLPCYFHPSSSQQLLLLSVSMGLEISFTFLKCSTLLCTIRAITSRVISLPDSPVHSLFGQNEVNIVRKSKITPFNYKSHFKNTIKVCLGCTLTFQRNIWKSSEAKKCLWAFLTSGVSRKVFHSTDLKMANCTWNVLQGFWCPIMLDLYLRAFYTECKQMHFYFYMG